MPRKLKYRPEIDGLRAIAVLGTLVFHAQFSIKSEHWLSGGFRGVDVFFVLSGYLITFIVLHDLKSDSFRLFNFYKRRALRILPALLFVLFGSLPLAWCLLLPQELTDFAKSLLSSLLFYANILFLSENPYWAAGSEYTPLLHTWSLAVEEQFYCLFPMLLMFTYKIWKKSIGWLLLIGFIASFALMIDLESKNPQATFYLLPYRLWEIIAGGILAWLQTLYGRKKYGFCSYLAVPVGLLGVLCSFSISSIEGFPLYGMTLMTIISTSLILWFADSKEWVTQLLSSRLLIHIGLISYSLYLWHYPVFVFARMGGYWSEDLNKLSLICLSILLAHLSYQYIESPFRKQKISKPFVYYSSLGLTTVFIFLFITFVIKTDGAQERFRDVYRLYKIAEPSNETLQRNSWMPLKQKTHFDPGSKIKVLVIGDSHGKDLFNAFYLNRELFNKYDFARSDLTFSDNKTDLCIADNPAELSKFFATSDFKQSHWLVISDYITQSKHISCLESFLSIAKVASKRIHLFSTQKFRVPQSMIHFIEKQIKEFRESSYWVDLYYIRKPLKTSTVADFFILSNNQISEDEGEKMQYQAIHPEIIPINNKLRSLSEKYQISFTNKFNYLCDMKKKKCSMLTQDKRKFYFDYSHLSLAGAKVVGQRLFELNIFQ